MLHMQSTLKKDILLMLASISRVNHVDLKSSFSCSHALVVEAWLIANRATKSHYLLKILLITSPLVRAITTTVPQVIIA